MVEKGFGRFSFRNEQSGGVWNCGQSFSPKDPIWSVKQDDITHSEQLEGKESEDWNYPEGREVEWVDSRKV